MEDLHQLISSTRYFVALSVVLILFMGFIYAPVFSTYALTDAYEFFWSAHHSPIFEHGFTQGGRPLFAQSVSFLFHTAHSISDLKYIRLVALTGVLILLALMYTYIKAKQDPVLAIVMTIFLAVSPAICLSIAWTSIFVLAWALPVAFVSALFFINAADSPYRNAKYLAWLTLSVFTGVISLMLYQPGYTLFIFILFIHFEKTQRIHFISKAIFIYLVTNVVYYLCFKATLLITGLPPLSRSGIETHILSKLQWFTNTAFVHAMSFNLLLIKNARLNLFRAPSGILFAICSFLYFYRNGLNKKTLTYAAIVVIVYLLAYLPNLASIERNASNRSLVTVTLLNAYFLFKSIAYLVTYPRTRIIIYTGVTLLFCIFGYTNVRWGITRIQTAEYQILKEATWDILKNDPSGLVHQINIIRPSRQFLEEHGIIAKESGGEFGLLSNSVEWTAEPMFKEFLEELGPLTDHDPASIRLTICNPGKEDKCRKGGPVIDIGSLFLTHYREYPK